MPESPWDSEFISEGCRFLLTFKDLKGTWTCWGCGESGEIFVPDEYIAKFTLETHASEHAGKCGKLPIVFLFEGGPWDGQGAGFGGYGYRPINEAFRETDGGTIGRQFAILDIWLSAESIREYPKRHAAPKANNFHGESSRQWPRGERFVGWPAERRAPPVQWRA